MPVAVAKTTTLSAVDLTVLPIVCEVPVEEGTERPPILTEQEVHRILSKPCKACKARTKVSLLLGAPLGERRQAQTRSNRMLPSDIHEKSKRLLTWREG